MLLSCTTKAHLKAFVANAVVDKARVYEHAEHVTVALPYMIHLLANTRVRDLRRRMRGK